MRTKSVRCVTNPPPFLKTSTMIITVLDGWRRRVNYHQQVIEQEDFSLVDAAALTPVWVGNLKELTAAHQPAVRQRQHLGDTHTINLSADRSAEQRWRRRRGLRASCRPPCAPRPGPETRGHRWSSAPTSGCVRRWRPAGRGGCPDRCPHLTETHTHTQSQSLCQMYSSCTLG